MRRPAVAVDQPSPEQRAHGELQQEPITVPASPEPTAALLGISLQQSFHTLQNEKLTMKPTAQLAVQ